MTTTNRLNLAQKLVELLKLNLSPKELFNQPDTVVIEPERSIKIAQIRRLGQQLSRKPLSLPKQLGIIFQAETMTIPAQNAFLKLLEEPTANTILVLATTNPYQLLPTLISRSQIITLDQPLASRSNKDQKISELLVDLSQARAGERLKLVEPFGKNRGVALNLCSRLLELLETNLHNSKAPSQKLKIGRNLKQTLALKQDLEANLNVKLALDHWALNLAS